MVALSATLAACGGGGSGDTGATNPPTTPAASDTSATSTTQGTDTASQAAGSIDAAKAIIVPGADTGSDTLAAVTSTPAVDTSPSAVVQAAVTATASTGAASAVAPARSGVGLNVSATNYYSSEVATFDVMKRASAWLTQCTSGTVNCSGFAAGAGTWDTKEQASLDLDANGYPNSLPAASDTTVKYRKVTTAFSANGVLPGGRYTVLYDGAGTISYGGYAVKQSSLSRAGRDVVDVTGGPASSFWLTIVATTPGNHLRNIRMYLPGGACASDYTTYAADASACGGTKGAFVPFESFPSARIWNPQFLADVKGFRTLRFMDWGATNSTQIQNWAQRSQMTDRVWSGPNGVPIEAMIDLANTVGADPWMNVPPHATDDYILQFARLATQKLSPNLKVNLEYANEAWNYAFPATKWMLAQGQLAWPDEVAKGTSIYTLETNWYARRLVQTCGIAKTSSPDASSRFRCISNTQASGPSQTDAVLACAVAAKTLGKACAKSVDVVSIAPYFGYYLGSAAMSSNVAGWATSSDGGLDKVFEELTGRDGLGKSVVAPLAALNVQAPSGAITQAAGWMAATRAVAAKYGLPMWAYEGGQHMVPPASDPNYTISNLMIAANRDPRMQAAYEQMMASWQAAGGQVFAYYSHTAVPSKSGSWGLKENMSDNANAKWKAALEGRDSACWWTGC